MKKIILPLLICLVASACLFSCGEYDKISSKTLELVIDESESGPGFITADLTLEGLEGSYEIYFAKNDEIFPDTEKIADGVGGETVHFERIFIPNMCYNIIIINDNGEIHRAKIPSRYVLLPDDEL